MLEFAALRIEAVRRGSNGIYRPIRDVHTEAVLGHAFRTPGPSAWNRLRPRTETVYETPDGSLLCTIRRPWWFGQPIVYEADNRAVAVLNRRSVLSAEGRFLAERSRWRSEGCFCNASGSVIARFATQRQGVIIDFCDEIEREPLIKMAILGAVLML